MGMPEGTETLIERAQRTRIYLTMPNFVHTILSFWPLLPLLKMGCVDF